VTKAVAIMKILIKRKALLKLILIIVEMEAAGNIKSKYLFRTLNRQDVSILGLILRK